MVLEKLFLRYCLNGFEEMKSILNTLVDELEFSQIFIQLYNKAEDTRVYLKKINKDIKNVSSFY